MSQIDSLLIATHNDGKAREIKELLAPYIENFKTAKDLNLPEPEETEDSFVGNALLKARAAAQASGMVALADDSGLSVNALGGDPGIYSARWAEKGVETPGGRDFNLAMQRVQDELGDAEDRSAAFICVLALVWPSENGKSGKEESFEGRIDGQIIWPARGEKGFGYDPIFIPNGYEMTFAEMEPEEKHKISHRARAFEQLKSSLVIASE